MKSKVISRQSAQPARKIISPRAQNINHREVYYSDLRRKNQKFNHIHLAEVLGKLETKRKRYSFQVLKQFYLFPDQTISEDFSINTYDKLFFDDEKIHTMVKIYETKEMQAKLWGFINLRTLHIKKKLEKMSSIVEKVRKEHRRKINENTFLTIRQYTMNIRPAIQQKNSSSENVSIQKTIKESLQLNKSIVSSENTEEIKKIQRRQPEIIRIPPSSYTKQKTSENERTASTVRIIYPQRRNQQKNYKVIDSRRQIVYHESENRPQAPIYKSYVVPTNTYTSRVQDIEKKSQKQLGEHLVHTVQGNCTININCTFENGEKVPNTKKNQVEVEKNKNATKNIIQMEKKMQSMDNLQTGQRAAKYSSRTSQHDSCWVRRSTHNDGCNSTCNWNSRQCSHRHQCYCCYQSSYCCEKSGSKEYDMEERIRYLAQLQKMAAAMDNK